MLADPRRSVPATDIVLNSPQLREPLIRLGRPLVRSVVRASQERVRGGTVDPEALLEDVLGHLPAHASTLHAVINATGVILHTNLGRAALSAAARDALVAATGYVDVEFDLATGTRAPRGRGVLAALRAALPDAGDVLVVNNGAAALLLAVTTLAQGAEVVWSRGEMVEIGDGFRLPDLVASTGARIREVGTTNRTVRQDYAAALGPSSGCILKVHPSNFTIDGFTASAAVTDLAGLPQPVQLPHPPILVGGGGPRLLRLAAREADIVGIHARLDPAGIDAGTAVDLGPDAIAEKVGWVQAELERVGRSAADVELQFSVYLTRIEDSARSAAATRSSFGAALSANPQLVEESPAVLVGSVERCVELLQERRERFGLSYWHLGHDVDAAARIVARLSGS